MARPRAPVLLALATLLGYVQGMFFVLEDKPRCFVLVEPKDTVIHVHYEFMEGKAGGGARLALSQDEVWKWERSRAGDKKVANNLNEHIREAKGLFKFSIPDDGMFRLCATKASRKDGPLRLSLDIDQGETDEYYKEVAKTKNLDDISLKVLKLNDRMNQILLEADFMKDREVELHATSEKINTGSLWWPILQVTILLVTGVIQVRHLTQFFKAKKLV